jgi:hypothetical protein
MGYPLERAPPGSRDILKRRKSVSMIKAMDQPDRRQIGYHDVEAAIPLSQDQHIQSAEFHEEESSGSPSWT